MHSYIKEINNPSLSFNITPNNSSQTYSMHSITATNQANNLEPIIGIFAITIVTTRLKDSKILMNKLL